MQIHSFQQLLIYLDEIDPQGDEASQKVENVRALMDIVATLTEAELHELRLRIYLIGVEIRRKRSNYL